MDWTFKKLITLGNPKISATYGANASYRKKSRNPGAFLPKDNSIQHSLNGIPGTAKWHGAVQRLVKRYGSF